MSMQDENFDSVEYPDNDQNEIISVDLDEQMKGMTATNEVNQNTATEYQSEAEQSDTKQELF